MDRSTGNINVVAGIVIIVIRQIYRLGVVATFIYMMVHDWPQVHGLVGFLVILYNGLRAVLWPLYLAGTLYFFHGLIPQGRL